MLALAVVPLQLLPRGPRGELRAEQLPPVGAAVEELELQPWTVDVHMGGEPLVPGGTPRPVKGQKRAPCVEGLEVNLGGYCWLPIQARPPNCPKQALAYGDSCLLPMAPQQGPPVGFDAGSP
ncbi:hypothetical protein BO221_14160 [Archangium sp. Cb G35]|nr:hypothetical protein BO221_14160 [Archangium sp. Cb G35]